MDVLVVAKAPVSGRVKTRLCPPCTPAEAAALAKASLLDTLAAATDAASNVVLALDGESDGWLPPTVRLVSQGDGSLSQRLATAWTHMAGPAVQVGMDTPQVSAGDLVEAYEKLRRPEVDAVLGPADDGGWWLIGLSGGGRPEVFEGVPMSQPDTGDLQARRLRDLGLRVELLEPRNDVDTIEDARQVAAEAPHTRFAAVFRSLDI